MELLLLREPSGVSATLGELFIGGVFQCHTLEDVVREIPGVPVERWKIAHRTAIPSGRYRIELEHSPKFGPGTLTIKDVPGFEFIRIHSGNDDEDTDGCILVGNRVGEEHIGPGTSRPALDALKLIVRDALQQPAGECWLRIMNP